MGNIHAYNDQILVNGSGQIVAADENCCCQNIGEPCAQCDGNTPAEIEATLSGAAANGCAECGAFNGIFTQVQRVDLPCCFDYVFPSAICGSPQATLESCIVQDGSSTKVVVSLLDWLVAVTLETALHAGNFGCSTLDEYATFVSQSSNIPCDFSGSVVHLRAP